MSKSHPVATAILTSIKIKSGEEKALESNMQEFIPPPRCISTDHIYMTHENERELFFPHINNVITVMLQYTGS